MLAEGARTIRSRGGAATNVVLHDGWLRVALGHGHADFHLRWLRHNCDQDRHALTHERTADSSDLPDDLRASAAEVVDDVLSVTWAHDGRTSRYRLSWLAEHAYARDRVAAPPPPAQLADIDSERGGNLRRDVDRTVALVAARGAAVVRRPPGLAVFPEDETEPLIDAFVGAGLHVIGSHFGRIEDLRTDNTTNQNTDQLGYTDASIEPHTDQPFIERPPRYQLLQAIRAAATGGESYLVDARAAAAHLGSVDARAEELLRTVPVRFHRRQKAFESVVVSPIFSGHGDSFQIRYSYFTQAPQQLPFERMEEWYRAYDRFARLVRDPRHQYRFLLRPGDFVLYDNHRMLHARTAFQGSRWLRGIYFNPR